MTTPDATGRVLVKVCGLVDVSNADDVVGTGVDAVGLNFVPTSRRRVDAEVAAQIAGAVRGRALVVAVVADVDLGALASLHRAVGFDVVQLHGRETPDDAANVARAFGLPVWKAIAVGDAEDVVAAARFGTTRILYDARAGSGSGGTGTSFDWTLLRAHPPSSPPFVLAGGLRPENVGEAVRVASPWMVDVASGVETAGRGPGWKDLDLVRRFVDEARRAKMGAP
ncbi:MAG: phosphoribosylanthranilate isomerase [Polyangiaceae bacterium]